MEYQIKGINLKITKSIIVLIVAVVFLVILSAFLSSQYFLMQNKIKTLENIESAKQFNAKVINFTKLFITKVLKAQNEVSFEERLTLENAVREIDDKEILTHWEEFVASKTEVDAQQNVKDLLEILLNKISVTGK